MYCLNYSNITKMNKLKNPDGSSTRNPSVKRRNFPSNELKSRKITRRKNTYIYFSHSREKLTKN